MNFNVGDVVKVGRVGVTHDPNGMGFCQPWQNSWIPEAMDVNVGLTFTISDIDPVHGVFFEESDSDNLNGGYGYPLNILEPIELVPMAN